VGHTPIMCGIPELERVPSWQGAAERQASRRASRAKRGGISFDKFVDRPLPPVAAKPASPKAVQRPPAREKPLLRVATPQRKAVAADNAVKRAKAAANCVVAKKSKNKTEKAAEKAEAAQVKAHKDAHEEAKVDKAEKGWSRAEIEECLQHHNKLRALHGAPPVQWCPRLARDAQKAADACVAKGHLFHSNHPNAGQNGAMGYSSFQGAIEGWYSEIKDYSFDSSGGFSMFTGHFTQVVWHDTTHVGMARDVTGTGSFIFCNYGPPGNYSSQFGQNVKPLLGTYSIEDTDKPTLPPTKGTPGSPEQPRSMMTTGYKARPVPDQTVLPKATVAQGANPCDFEKCKQQRMQRRKAQQEHRDRENIGKIIQQQRARAKAMFGTMFNG